LPVIALLTIAASPAAAQYLHAEKLPGDTIRRSWSAEPTAVSDDLAGGARPGSDLANGTCRTPEDGVVTGPIRKPTRQRAPR
jgi:hypothetical protein